jgi:hypothetical protein
MSDAEQSRNFPILIVYWFLAALALTFALFALREVYRVKTHQPFQVRVLDRTMSVEVRIVPGKGSSSRKSPFLFSIAELKLERMDTRQVFQHRAERRLENDEFVTLQFLDEWKPGTVVAVSEGADGLNADASNRWPAVLGLTVAAWMMGTFAWMAKPFAYGGSAEGMGYKFLALAVLPVGVAVFGIAANIWKDREETAMQRVPVEGRSMKAPVGELVAEIHAMGVKTRDDVPRHLGETTISYCEFAWNGKRWRTASLWCQPLDGGVCMGRLNPADPRDVKWGAEP